MTGLLTSLCLSINRLQRIRQPIVSPRVGRRLSAIAFFSLLFIAGIGTLLNALLNRSQFPSVSSWKKLPNRVEAFLADRIPGRARMVGWNAQLRTGLLGGSSNPRVWIGSDGWLFFNHLADAEPDFGAATTAQSWNSLMRSRQDWCRQNGMKYRVLAAPNKQSIYPERLPARIRERATDDLLDRTLNLWSISPAVAALDLREELARGKSVAPTYLKNDSHWSPYGCYRGALRTIDSLSMQCTAMPLLSADDFEFDIASMNVADTWRLLGLPGDAPSEKCLWPCLRASQARIADEAIELDAGDGLDHLRPVVWVRPDGVGPRVVLFGDSFADERFQEILAQCCSRLVFVPTYQMPTSILERERPDIVIVQFVERALQCEKPWAPRR